MLSCYLCLTFALLIYRILVIAWSTFAAVRRQVSRFTRTLSIDTLVHIVHTWYYTYNVVMKLNLHELYHHSCIYRWAEEV